MASNDNNQEVPVETVSNPPKEENSGKGKASVEFTKDEAISKANASDDELDTGEITPAQASTQPGSTRERESGKTLPRSKSIAKKHEMVGLGDDNGVTHGTTIPNGAKLVPVKLTQYKRCKIGPRWYEFSAGKVYHVLPEVKNVLMKSGSLQAM